MSCADFTFRSFSWNIGHSHRRNAIAFTVLVYIHVVYVCVFACGSRGQMLGVFFLLISTFIVFYFYLKKIYYMPVSVCCICICLWRPEEGVSSPRVRVRDGCELPNVGAGNPARTLQAYINCQAVTSVAVPLILTD